MYECSALTHHARIPSARVIVSGRRAAARHVTSQAVIANRRSL